jgi:sulfate adenylyltransferase
MPGLPHGGRLVDSQLEGAEAERQADSLSGLPGIRLNEREACDLEMLGSGALSPLEGFMDRAAYEGVLDRMRLPEGPVWPLPVTLSLKPDSPRPVPGGVFSLVDPSGRISGSIEAGDVFSADLAREAQLCLGTVDPSHPGVAYLQGLTGEYVGGKVLSLRRREVEPFSGRKLDPKETRVLFKALGWDTIVAFQTRNPVHRAHEYIQKCALEIADGLLLHPLVGQTKDDDIPADVRMKCYDALLEGYFPKSRTILSVFPAAMRYAGPREAVFHALVRKNYGCTHFIVGRDHAGVGNFYGTYDAQRIFDGFDPSEIGIEPLRFEHSFFCRKCDGMASPKTCPHPDSDHVALSGKRVREMLALGEVPPLEFTRPEVADILISWSRERSCGQ